MTQFDYDNYGAFKGQPSRGSASSRLAGALGVKNRYLRFINPAGRHMPLVEVGCGTGQFMRTLLDQGYTDVRGVEPSQSYQTVVDPDLIFRGYANEYLQTCAVSSIGTVLALDVFEHIPAADLKALLSLIHTRLLPGGTVVFRVPNMASPLAMVNYFGDLSHTTALSEISIGQLAFGSGLTVSGVHAEPFSYPRSLATLTGILLWPFYKVAMTCILAAFGIRCRVLTPNLVCVLTKP